MVHGAREHGTQCMFCVQSSMIIRKMEKEKQKRWIQNMSDLIEIGYGLMGDGYVLIYWLGKANKKNGLVDIL